MAKKLRKLTKLAKKTKKPDRKKRNRAERASAQVIERPVRVKRRPSPAPVPERQERKKKNRKAVILPRINYKNTYEQEYYRQTTERGSLRKQLVSHKPMSEKPFRDDKILAREYGTKLRNKDGKNCKKRPTDNRSKGGGSRSYIPWCVRRV